MEREKISAQDGIELAKVISLDDWRKSRGEGNRVNSISFNMVRKKYKRVAHSSNTGKSILEPGGKDSTELENIRIANYLITVAISVQDKKEKIRLAEEAISIFPHCSAAFNILAVEKATSAIERFGYYKKGVDGGEFFTRTNMLDFGRKFSAIERQPYIVSLKGAGDALWEMGENDASLVYYWRVVRLDESDRLGVVQILATRLLEMDRGYALSDFFISSNNGKGPVIPWVKVFHYFREGDFEKALENYRIASQKHPGVLLFLTGEKVLPEKIPPYEEISGKMLDAWGATLLKSSCDSLPEAMHWLKGISKNEKPAL